MMDRKRITDHMSMIAEIKRGSLELRIAIEVGDGEVVGSLVPVTWSDASDPVALQRFTEWRNANMDRFLTQFVATPARTERWLRYVVLPNDRQLLFWVVSGETVVGHIGFKDLTEADVLSDNAIRADRGGHPKLFVAAHHAMFKWLCDTFGIETIYGYVFSDNIPAVMMNRQVRFSSWERHALHLAKDKGDDVWVVGEALDEDPGDRFCWKIAIQKNEVYELLES